MWKWPRIAAVVNRIEFQMVSLTSRWPLLRSSAGHSYGISILNFINLRGKVRKITRKRYTAQTRNFVKLFIYLSSIIFEIHSFCSWMVSNLFFDCVTVKTSNSTAWLKFELVVTSARKQVHTDIIIEESHKADSNYFLCKSYLAKWCHLLATSLSHCKIWKTVVNVLGEIYHWTDHVLKQRDRHVLSNNCHTCKLDWWRVTWQLSQTLHCPWHCPDRSFYFLGFYT